MLATIGSLIATLAIAAVASIALPVAAVVALVVAAPVAYLVLKGYEAHKNKNNTIDPEK